MHITLYSVITLILGVVFIVFSEVVGSAITNFLNGLNPMERDVRRAKFFCIVVGTFFVISAALSIFGSVPLPE